MDQNVQQIGDKPLNKLQLVAELTKVQQQIESGEIVAFVILAAHKKTDEADEQRVISVCQASGDDAIREGFFADSLFQVALKSAMHNGQLIEEEAEVC